MRNSVKAIIVRHGHLLATRNRDDQGDFYLLPGGGQEPGETLHTALRRECREEIGAEIEIGALRFVREYIAAHHEFAAVEPDVHQVEFMFLCRLSDGAVPGGGSLPDKWQQGVEWLPLDELEQHRLYPQALRPLLKRLPSEDGPVYLGDIN